MGRPSATSSLNRSPSIDSLIEASDQAGSDLDDRGDDDDLERLSDSDSIAEIGRITGQIRVDVHRRSDLDDVKNVQPLDGPVIKAFLEKSHEQCEYTNCGYRRRHDGEEGSCRSAEPDIMVADEAGGPGATGHGSRKTSPTTPAAMLLGHHQYSAVSPLSSCPSSPGGGSAPATTSHHPPGDTISNSANNVNGSSSSSSSASSSGSSSGSNTLTSTGSLSGSLKNRRNSIASSGSVGRMETIIEEPIEPKVSVKEILARFETLREAAEVTLHPVHHQPSRFCPAPGPEHKPHA